MSWKNQPWSTKIVVITTIILLLVSIVPPKKWSNQKVINNDVAEYYAYLPATIIYHDLSFDFKKNLREDFSGRIWVIKPEGKDFKVIKMTMGLSILFLPFFLLGHLFALLTPFAADGYTAPYEAAISLSNVTFALLGLYFLKKLLKRHFTEKITSWTLIAIAFATNIFFYSSLHVGTSHVYNFALITLFLYLNEKWHEAPGWKQTIGIGLLTGLIVLIRPSNLIVVLVFILYGVYNKSTLLQKVHLYRINFWKLITIAIMGLLVVSPQLIYWKAITGDWIYYTYGNESFFFYDPELIKGLFSFRKGWLIYTPMMGLAIIGMFFLFREKKNYSTAIPVFFIVNIYIIYSWWAWWYGGGFGSRPMIDSYGLLAIPLALTFQQIFKRKLWLKYTAQVLMILFVALNLWQSKQYKRGILHYDGMTKEAYFRLFFSWDFPNNYKKYIDRPDYKAAHQNIDRTESYHTKNLDHQEKKLFNFVSGINQLKTKLMKMYDHRDSGYPELLAKVIKKKHKHQNAYKLVKEYAKIRIRKIITNDSNWYEKIKQQAKEENKAVDSMLKEHVNYMFFVDYKKNSDD
ncbi:MAG: hypothetical protein K9I68_05600 [Bacteroidales bacterium]|nr:hypothetical protein [Bacteroidales bacterium]MCF8337885.1 hypothetical protein [Bacteroidales bacterium]